MKIRELISEATREQIANLQNYLNTKGGRLSVDGIMGPRTRAAIQQLLKGDGNFLQTSDGVATDDSGFPVMSGQGTLPQAQQRTQPAQQARKAGAVGPGSDKEIAGVVKAGPGFTDVKTADGEVQRRQGARNWRNNNPGNIIAAGNYAKSKGAVGSDGRFAVFPTLEMGFDAKKDLLFGSAYINLSIADAIAKYAPPNENDTDRYIRAVVQATGAAPETKMSQLSEPQRDKLLQTVTQQEGFKVGTITTIGAGATA